MGALLGLDTEVQRAMENDPTSGPLIEYNVLCFVARTIATVASTLFVGSRTQVTAEVDGLTLVRRPEYRRGGSKVVFFVEVTGTVPVTPFTDKPASLYRCVFACSFALQHKEIRSSVVMCFAKEQDYHESKMYAVVVPTNCHKGWSSHRMICQPAGICMEDWLAGTAVVAEDLKFPLSPSMRRTVVGKLIAILYALVCQETSHNDMKPANIIMRGHDFQHIDMGSCAFTPHENWARIGTTRHYQHPMSPDSVVQLMPDHTTGFYLLDIWQMLLK